MLIRPFGPRRAAGPASPALVVALSCLALVPSSPAAAGIPLLEDAAADSTVAALEVGGDVRVRGYDLDNVWDSDSDDDKDHLAAIRHRTRLYARLELERGVGAYVRIANQNWGEGVTYADQWEADNRSNKLIVDNAYIDVDGAFGLPVDLRLGRQDAAYGSGFVVCDGQSQMASTANYFDGARLRLRTAAGTSLDLIHLKDQENARDVSADDDLTLTGAYLVHASMVAEGSEEIYALRREDQRLERKIWLFGARVAHRWSGGLDYSLEGGLQRGDLAGDVDQRAWGVKSEAGWTFAAAPGQPRVFVGYVGLSGDDPATAENERWDVFYGGWPQFGDLLAWSYVNLGAGFNNVSVYDPGYAQGSSTGGEAVYSNLLMPNVGIEAAPAERLTARLSWSPIRAHHAVGPDDVGDYWQLGLRYRYSRQLGFSIYAALLDPGEAFGPGADAQHEVFWETNLAF